MRRSFDLDFADFVTVASPGLFRTAYAVSGDRQLAEDALQAGLLSRVHLLVACRPEPTTPRPTSGASSSTSCSPGTVEPGGAAR